MTSSAGIGGFTRRGVRRRARSIASRIAARSTSVGTPLVSCRKTRDGLQVDGVACESGRAPVEQRPDLVGGDLLAVLVAQQVLQHDPQAVGQVGRMPGRSGGGCGTSVSPTSRVPAVPKRRVAVWPGRSSVRRCVSWLSAASSGTSSGNAGREERVHVAARVARTARRPRAMPRSAARRGGRRGRRPRRVDLVEDEAVRRPPTLRWTSKRRQPGSSRSDARALARMPAQELVDRSGRTWRVTMTVNISTTPPGAKRSGRGRRPTSAPRSRRSPMVLSGRCDSVRRPRRARRRSSISPGRRSRRRRRARRNRPSWWRSGPPCAGRTRRGLDDGVDVERDAPGVRSRCARRERRARRRRWRSCCR